jgi:hypothetical protein
MRTIVDELLATEAALDELGARGIEAPTWRGHSHATQPAGTQRTPNVLSMGSREPRPRKNPDPQPGDFDPDLSTIGDELVSRYRGGSDATLRLVSIDGEDARRLERIAKAPGKKPGDVVADLLRDADRPAA